MFTFFIFLVCSKSILLREVLDGHEIDINLTPYFGYIFAFYLLKFPNLLTLNISGCDNIIANDFVECVGFVSSLTIVKLVFSSPSITLLRFFSN